MGVRWNADVGVRVGSHVPEPDDIVVASVHDVVDRVADSERLRPDILVLELPIRIGPHVPEAHIWVCATGVSLCGRCEKNADRHRHRHCGEKRYGSSHHVFAPFGRSAGWVVTDRVMPRTFRADGAAQQHNGTDGMSYRCDLAGFRRPGTETGFWAVTRDGRDEARVSDGAQFVEVPASQVGKVLAQQTIRVLIGTALPGAVRVGEAAPPLAITASAQCTPPATDNPHTAAPAHRAITRIAAILYRSKSHRCTSSGVTVLLDEGLRMLVRSSLRPLARVLDLSVIWLRRTAFVVPGHEQCLRFSSASRCHVPGCRGVINEDRHVV
jgi:hypothetical protein